MAERRNGQPQTHPNPDPVERAEQAYRVVDLKREGKTFRVIAEEMGCSPATAHKLFKEGIKLMAPPEAADEIVATRLQLEQQYADIQDDLEHTNDPNERVKLYAVALANIKERIRLFGGPDMIIQHNVKDEFTREIEDLYIQFDADQDIRNAARARTRGRR